MSELLPIVATVATGLFTGSLLTEAMILVPYWRRMPAAEFLRLHKTLGPNLFRYFAPLTTIAVVLSIINALVDNGQTTEWIASAVLSVLTLLVFSIYFKKANASFKSGDISETALPQELARWAAWHWFRTVLMLTAFLLSVTGHTGMPIS